MTSEDDGKRVGQLLDTHDLANALGSDEFKQFLDHIPMAIAVSQLGPSEGIVYANAEFERLTDLESDQLKDKFWDVLPGVATDPSQIPLASAITEDRDYIGAYILPAGTGATEIDAWSNIIKDDQGQPVYRLVALIVRLDRTDADHPSLAQQIEEKDTQLRELQHRVKNNLQLITGLIRVEARGVTAASFGDRFDRLAGRVEALGLLYKSLGDASLGETVDLGAYLSQIATAVMGAHAAEGIHLDMRVDSWPVSINIALPAGLVVNELLTNSLKHAFAGREGGTITLHCLSQGGDCRVLVADDGVGLPPGSDWPNVGKLSAMIVRSLVHNAQAQVDVKSRPGEGLRVTILFTCADTD